MEGQLEEVVLVEAGSRRGDEKVIPDHLETRPSMLLRKGFYKPIIVNRESMVILDGHHKWTAAKSLGLARVPVIMVDYLVDEGVLVDVWPDCGKESITKAEVLEMGVSGDVFPPKTSRHTLPFKIPSIRIPLSELKN